MEAYSILTTVLRTKATMVEPGDAPAATAARSRLVESSSAGGVIAAWASSCAVAPWKQSSQTPYPCPLAIGGPKTRQVCGREAYRSQVPCSGSRAGHGSSLAKSSKLSAGLPSGSASSRPEAESPGNWGARRCQEAAARAATRRARSGSVCSRAESPCWSLSASAGPMVKTPTQHCAQPARHKRWGPLRMAASAKAPSIRATKLRSWFRNCASGLFASGFVPRRLPMA